MSEESDASHAQAVGRAGVSDGESPEEAAALGLRVLALGSDSPLELPEVMDAVPVPMMLVDRDGVIVVGNAEAMSVFQYERDELTGLNVDDLVPADLRARHRRMREAYAARPERRRMGEAGDLRAVRRDGSTLPVEIGLNPVTIDDTDYTLVVTIDISPRLEARLRAEHQALHDELTGLPNRSHFQQHLARELAATARPDLALVLLDLDHFKRINDSLGHHIGDDLLVAIAERLRSWQCAGEFVARLGGDEFVVVITTGRPGDTLGRRLTALAEEVLRPATAKGYDLALTASIGVTLVAQDHVVEPADVLREADIALYQAKASGRNATRWFEPWMLEANDELLSLSSALRRGLDDDEISVVYQPQVELRTGRVVCFEALARWTSAELGPVGPDRFIPVAEDGGLIGELGDRVLRDACHALATVQGQLGEQLRMAVNVSPRQLRGSDWLDHLRDALADAGLHPSQVEIEITENLLLEDHGDVHDKLQAVRDFGVTVAIDDFGRGFSSLAYLTRFPIDKIKIDRSFVQAIASRHDEAPIVDAILLMGHALGLRVVAEGVETLEQEAYLRDRGCDKGQGFLYSRGTSLDDLADTVRALSDRLQA